MLVKTLRWGAVALGVLFALNTSLFAGDDTYRLDSKKSADAPKFTLGGVGAFSHDARAKVGDEQDVDVHFRGGYGGGRGYYGGGYGRGYYGGGLYGGYGFRGGFYGGYGFRVGFYGGYGYWPRYYGGYGYGYSYPGYYYPSYYATPVYYAAPAAYYSPCGGTMVASTYNLPGRGPMTTGEPPLAPRTIQPPYRGDEPPPKQSYQYNGGPTAPVPMPLAEPPAKGATAEGRIVKLSAAKKLAYPAYGENRNKASDTDDLLTVKKTSN
jgi:hypothetical protein